MLFTLPEEVLQTSPKLVIDARGAQAIEQLTILDGDQGLIQAWEFSSPAVAR